MSAKPIIFRADMVLAILEGRKTQTRRAWKGAHKYAAGDVLWVKEPLVKATVTRWKAPTFEMALYAADQDGVALERNVDLWQPMPWKWKRDKLPAMFMPKAACRLRLEVVGVRRERLDEITQADAEAEGFNSINAFWLLWITMHERSWHAEVEVIEFRVAT